MSIERQRKLLELLDEALELPPAERPAFLDEHCEDGEMRREVESMLADTTDPEVGKPIFSVHARDAAIGRQIGDYRIVELLGRGGMGAVYLAEREHFEQRVALKLLRRGLDYDDVLVRRFHNERQILAHLDHPNIARLFDGGTTEDLVPYFVMEHVEGVPIDRYCQAEALPVEDRLRLFRKVCSAVEFAHRRLVVHRDLKPGNVLITAGGEPKLLDFGIAKALDHGVAAETLATGTGFGPMTPRYASPEQIKLQPITTASDVYSLGVMLYELLTGRTPYRLASDRSDDVARAVCEQDPEKPSTAVRRAPGEGRDTIADPGKLRQVLSGDLDSIVLKALRKEPEHRYGSVEQLSEDLRRYLDGEPVSAREGTAAYRLGKFVRRYWLPLSVAAAFVLLSVGFGVVSTVLRQQEEEAREIAEAAQAAAEVAREAAEAAQKRSDQTLDFLKLLFREAGPDQAQGQELSAREILDRGEQQVFGEDLAQELDLEARIEILTTLGQIRRQLGDFDRSFELYEEALKFARDLYEADDPRIATFLSNHAVSLNDFGRHGRAEELLREALAIRQELGQKEPGQVFRIQSNLASTLMLQGRNKEAEELHLGVLDARQDLYGPDDRDVATSRVALGGFYLNTDELEEAELHLVEALRIREKRLGPKHTGVASVLNLLGRVKARQGETDAARELLNRALEIRSIRQADHPGTARTKTHLADVLIGTDPDKARELLKEAIGSLERSKPGGRELAEARSVLGALEVQRRNFEDAEPLLLESHRLLRQMRGSKALATRSACRRVVELYTAWQKPEELEGFLAEYPDCEPATSSQSPWRRRGS